MIQTAAKPPPRTLVRSRGSPSPRLRPGIRAVTPLVWCAPGRRPGSRPSPEPSASRPAPKHKRRQPNSHAERIGRNGSKADNSIMDDLGQAAIVFRPVIVFWLFFAAASGRIAHKKNLPISVGLFLGTLLGLVGLIMVACLPSNPKQHRAGRRRVGIQTPPVAAHRDIGTARLGGDLPRDKDKTAANAVQCAEHSAVAAEPDRR